MSSRSIRNHVPRGSAVLVDGCGPAYVFDWFPRGSTSFAFPHARLQWEPVRAPFQAQHSGYVNPEHFVCSLDRIQTAVDLLMQCEFPEDLEAER